MRDAAYREAVLVYIDILGFRKLIETSTTTPSTVPTILNALRELKQQTSEGGRVIHEEGKQRPTWIFRGFNFSDLTVRATSGGPALRGTPTQDEPGTLSETT